MRPILFAILLCALLGSSCTPFSLSVSEDLKANHDEYSVKGRQGILIKQKLSFGEFSTTKVKRSWTRGSNSMTGLSKGIPNTPDWENIISMEYIRKKQTIHFNLTDGANQSDVYCVSRFQAEDLHLGKNPNSLVNIALEIAGIGHSSSNLYYVQIFQNGAGTPWQLILDNQASQAEAKKYRGVIAKSATEYYTIVPVTQLERNGKSGNILMGSVGFEIRNPEGRTMAAVSMMDNGVVYLGKTTADERFLMANICSALLLQEQIG
jgi:hypothetical protein